jgi:hypothetical protein
MSDSKYRLVICRIDDEPVMLMPGGQGERDLVSAIVDKVTGVGVFRTQAQVRDTVRRAIEAVLLDAKAEVKPV